jgi:hypothetical protein
MCIRCNIFIPKNNKKIINEKEDDIVENNRIQYFENLLREDNYENLNTTSINIILYACIGIYGNKCKEISIKGIKKIIDWLNTQELLYLPKTGDESMYNPTVLFNLVKWCESYKNNENLDKNKLLDILCKKFEEFDKEELDNNLYYLFLKKSKKICMYDILISGSIFGLLSYKKIMNKSSV